MIEKKTQERCAKIFDAPTDYVIDVIGDEFVRFADDYVPYGDCLTKKKWKSRPDEFVTLDFLRFIRYGEDYYLRIPGLGQLLLAFKKEELWLKTDVFQRKCKDAKGNEHTIFIHRAKPNMVFEFLGYDEKKGKRLKPLNGDEPYIFRYARNGKKPIKTRERVLPTITEDEYRYEMAQKREQMHIESKWNWQEIRTNG